METRLASATDLPHLVNLHAESFGEAKWDASQIASSLALETTYAAVVEEKGALYGFILCQVAQEDAEILTFCVTPSARRKGAGTQLLEALLAYAHARHVERIFLEVAADNRPAFMLYEKTGFKPAGKRKGYYARGTQKSDALMLEFKVRQE